MKMKQKYLRLLVILIISIVAVFAYTSVFRSSQSEKKFNQKLVINDLQSFVDEWNDKAVKVNNRYCLFGSDAATDEIIIDRLKKWYEPFNKLLPDDFQQQLADFSNLAPATSFHAWAKFCKENYKPEPLNVNTEMTSRELATALNNYLGIRTDQGTPDYITQETVKLVVYRNGFCDYFEHEKKRLHNAGIDSDISFCQPLSTNGKYPALDKLVEGGRE